MKNKQILVVEDNEQNRKFIARFLTDLADCTVETAVNGVEGLQKALNHPYDLIVTDISMPEKTGLEMLIELRQADVQTPAIVMTAESSEKLAVQAMRVGARDFFTKPFDPGDFAAAARRIMANNHQRNGTNHASLIIQLNDPLMLIDSHNRLILHNPAARQFFDRLSDEEGPRGRQLKDLTANRSFLEVVESGMRGEIEKGEVQLASGETYAARVSHIKGHGYMILMHDVTTFIERDRAKTEMMEVVSHQVRSPLTAILSYVDLLRRTGKLTTDQVEFARLVSHNVSLINETLKDLLDLGKIETGQDDSRERVSLAEMAEYAIETMKSRADAKGQSINFQADSTAPDVLGNAVRLRQVYINLIENAIKYTPIGGRIDLSIASEGGQVFSVITDTGIGIPIEDQPHIFDRFYRASEVSNAYEGTGLGLSIVKSIVESHEGRIWVHSRPGEGTRFTVVMPGHKPE